MYREQFAVKRYLPGFNAIDDAGQFQPGAFRTGKVDVFVRYKHYLDWTLATGTKFSPR